MSVAWLYAGDEDGKEDVSTNVENTKFSAGEIKALVSASWTISSANLSPLRRLAIAGLAAAESAPGGQE